MKNMVLKSVCGVRDFKTFGVIMQFIIQIKRNELYNVWRDLATNKLPPHEQLITRNNKYLNVMIKAGQSRNSWKQRPFQIDKYFEKKHTESVQTLIRPYFYFCLLKKPPANKFVEYFFLFWIFDYVKILPRNT